MVGEFAEVRAFENDRAGGGRDQEHDRAGQGSFPAAGFAYDAKDFTFFHGQVHAVDSPGRVGPGREESVGMACEVGVQIADF